MIVIISGKMQIPENERFIGFVGDNLHSTKQFLLPDVSEQNCIYRLYLTFDDGTVNYFVLDNSVENGSTLLTWTILQEHIFKSGVVNAQIKCFSADAEVYHTTSDYFIVGDSAEYADNFKQKDNAEFLRYERQLNSILSSIQSGSYDFVTTNRQIAGVDLSDDITANEMQEALGVYPLAFGSSAVRPYSEKVGQLEYVGSGLAGNKKGLYVLLYKSDSDEVRVKLVTSDELGDYVKTDRTIAGLGLVDDIATEQLYSALGLSQWAKEKKPSTYGQPRSLSMLDYFGANKKVVFIGDSFTQGFGSSECVSYSVTDDEGNNFNIVGNGAEYGTLNNLTDYEIGKKLWSLGSRIWYEAIDGNGYAHRLINYLKNKFGCTAKNYGMSGITTGHLLSQNMNAENSDLVTGGGAETETVTLCGTQSDWVVGGVDTNNGSLIPVTTIFRTADYIELDNYTGNIVISTSNTKFKVFYYNENDELTSSTTYRTNLTLDKTLGSKVIVTVGTGDISKYSEITITAGIKTETAAENIRVIEGLTNGFDTVFLTIGGNDRGFQDYTHPTTGEVVTAEQQFKTNLTNLVKYLVNTANKKVILMSMTPCADDDTMRMSMEVIDGIIEEVATEYNLPFVSCYNGMLDYCEKIGISKDTFFDTMVTDGLHPNNEGYAVVEAIICEQLGINDASKNYVDKRIAELQAVVDNLRNLLQSS